MLSQCYNVFMAIFNNRTNTTKNFKQARKGACFSVTMPYSVENRLKEIQRQMGLNSKSQTIVFLIHHYDKEQRAFDSIDKLSVMLDKFMAMEKKDSAKLVEQQTLPYNKTNN